MGEQVASPTCAEKGGRLRSEGGRPRSEGGRPRREGGRPRRGSGRPQEWCQGKRRPRAVWCVI